MTDRPAGNPTPPDDVRRMFDRIAARYDRMNTVMTLGLDRRWRRAAVAAARPTPGRRIVDVACGTGPLARTAAAAVGPGGEVIGVDVSEGMLAIARAAPAAPGSAPIRYLVGDALALPCADGTADAALIGFGLRNVADYAGALAELRRVVRPGGRVVVLEIGDPRRAPARLLRSLWFRGAVPLLGRLAGEPDAYRYLPDSVRGYPAPATIAAMLAARGLHDVEWRWLAGGLVTLHAATVPPPSRTAWTDAE
jgi:demethylmenaquinone methyltransferase/2-methoxy-6-polyprenyl-1,4-benzoquinol methylase